MASVAGGKRRIDNKSCKIKYNALKELEKERITKPTTEEVLKAVSVLEDFSLFSDFGEAMLASLKDLNYNIKQDIDINSKQTVITDFFLSE